MGIGTILLWIYWPSFNGAATTGDYSYRAIINTYFAMAACVVVTCATSALVIEKGKLSMVTTLLSYIQQCLFLSNTKISGRFT